MEPHVSVVVPTYRRLGLLERCLKALESQTLAPRKYEVLVVDDAREDHVRARVEALAASSFMVLRYLRPPAGRRGPAAARNVGWLAARGEIVAFTDDDTVPASDWLQRGLDAMQGATVAASGQVLVPVPRRPTDYERNVKGLERTEFATANCFVRHEALVRIGGFDERFRKAWREDSDLHFALLQHYGNVARAHDAVVLHPVRPAGWGISLREQANVLYDALLYKKYPRLYRTRIRPTPPWSYYAATLAAVCAPLAALSGHIGTALCLGIVWAAITFRLAATRLRGTSRTPSHLLEMLATSALIPPLSVYWRLAGALRFRTPFV